MKLMELRMADISQSAKIVSKMAFLSRAYAADKREHMLRGSVGRAHRQALLKRRWSSTFAEEHKIGQQQLSKVKREKNKIFKGQAKVVFFSLNIWPW